MIELPLWSFYGPGIGRPSVSELLAVCASLSSSRLILSEHGRNDICQKLHLNIGMDDVTYALKADWMFSFPFLFLIVFVLPCYFTLKKNASLQKNPMPFSRSRFTHKKLDFLFKKVPSRLWKTFDSVPRLCSIYKTHFLKNRCDFMGRKSEMLRCRRFSDQVFYSSHQGSTQINISRIFK